MPQLQSPWIEAAYGWNYGEDNWNTGMDLNLLKFSVLFDSNINGAVASLPPPVNGEAYFNTTDNRLYFVVTGNFLSVSVPKWFVFKDKTTGVLLRFNGTALEEVSSMDDLANALDVDKGAALVGRGCQVVESIASLRLLDKNSASQTALVIGYYQKGDYDPCIYYYDPLDTSTADNGGTVIVAADAARWKLVTSQEVSVSRFGAKGDGVTDDTAAIQAAFSNTSVRKITANPSKTYRITDTLTLNKTNVEVDFNKASILLDDATGLKSHIVVGNGVSQRNGILLKNITFSRNQVATSGYAIDFNFCGTVKVEGCRVFGQSRIWAGVRFRRTIISHFLDNYIDNTVRYGIYLIGTDASANRTIDTVINGNRIEGGVTAVESSDFVEGLFVRDNIFYNTSGIGVVVDATSNTNGLVSFKFQDNDFDTCAGGGLYMDKVGNVQITDNWFASNGVADIQLKETTDATVVTDNQMYPSALGISCFGNAAHIADNLISGGTTQIRVNSSATRTDILTNTLSNAVNGIDLTTAANTYVFGNNIYSMSGSTILNFGGAGVVIKDNVGDGALGIFGIAVGASPFTYTAGSRPQVINIYGGTVSQVAIGVEVVSTTTNTSVHLSPYQAVTVTYSVAPQMKRNVL